MSMTFAGSGFCWYRNGILYDRESMVITMKTLRALAPLLVRYHGTDRMHGIVQEEFADRSYLKLPDYHVQIKLLSQDRTPHGYY